MSLRRLRPNWRTLRFRLAAWNALVVVLTALVLLVGLREAVRMTLLNELDQLLSEDLREIGLALRELQYPTAGDELEKELQRKARGHSQHGWFVQLLDTSGRELWASYNVPAERPSITARDGVPASIHHSRVIQQRLPRPGAEPILVRVGASLAMLREDMARIDRLVALAAGMALLIAPACGYWLAGRATRPLAEIIITTERLRPECLNERLSLRNTGDELDQLSRTVNHLLDRIAVYLDQKQDFLANAAHELRTPLAAIRSSAEVALSAGHSVEEHEDFLAGVIEQSEALEAIVNQLLLLAETRLDPVLAHWERVRLDEIVSKATDMFQAAAEVQEIELQRGELPEVEVSGNRDHLRQVLNNLLDNAIKFTPAGGWIRVQLDSDEAAGLAVLRISDSGQGIAEDDLPHIFERFYRADKSRRRDRPQRSTGLGLSICEAVVQAHRGTITVRSRLAEGTEFTVTLPLAARKLDPSAAATTVSEKPPACERSGESLPLG